MQNSARIVLRPSEVDKNTPSLLKVFSVETLSTAFFDDYKYKHYSRFVEAMMGWSVVKKGKIDQWTKTGKESAFYIKAFKEKYTEEKAQAEARNFVKKLLGRIVFLYFVQKKGWLGASNTDYKDGFDGTISDKDGFGDGFMLHLFKSSNSKDNFYEIWLKELFFNALNQPRKDDNFTMPDKSVVKIPFLNGGLFEVEKHDKIPTILPAKLFHNPDFEDDEKQCGFLDFLNSFNFTIYEDSPEDHTVAVDPEMLGHIFENLLEDNKDKGAYYTPKEIVHYMCQESIIEYLNTKLNPDETPIYNDSSGLELVARNDTTLLTHANPDYESNRLEIEDFVKNKVNNDFLLKNAKAVNNYLDNVKVCDPAIGSGAFPMGIMQEIFALKMVLYDLEFANDNHADKNLTIVFHEHEFHQNYRRDTKLNIIQNSIYGVDIEKGAVDIARLRFWLSLIVDENKPQALPNFDYKVVVGDSLIPKFDGEILEIDWEKKTTISPKFNVFIANGKQLLAQIVTKQKAYFDPKTKNKPKAAAEIRNLKINLLINQLAYNKLYYLNNNIKLIDSGLGLTTKEKQKNLAIDLHMALLDKQTKKLNQLLSNHDLPFDHFDWKLDFPEILNDQVAAMVGFDIVIGNPPYFVLDGKMKKEIDDFSKFQIYDKCKGGKLNAFELFLAKTDELLADKSICCQIFQNSFLADNSSKLLRKHYLDNNNILKIDSFPERDNASIRIFESVKMSICILLSKKIKSLNYSFKLKIHLDNTLYNFSTVDYSKNEIYKLNPNNFVIPSLLEDDKNVFIKYNSQKIKYIEFFECIEGELNMTFHKNYMSSNNNLPKIIKGAQVQRYFLTDKPSQGQIEFVDKENYLKDYSKSKKSTHYKLERIALQGITGANDKIRIVSSYVDKDLFCANSCNYIISNDNNNSLTLKFLLAVLNSKLTNWIFRKTSTNSNVNCYEINNLMLPNNSLSAQQPFINLVDKILEAKKSGNITQHWENEIDIMVYKLYELSYEEACVIDNSLKKSDFEKYKV